ncbi:T9SS type A sorting domain-containing protein, partial [Formosa undariae]
PVPAKNTLNIKGITKDTTVQIYNITGALVQSTAIRVNAAAIDTSSLNSGIYFIKIENTVKKFVINK